MNRIRNAPITTTKKQVRPFLCVVSYYRKFVDEYSKITAPLTDLTWAKLPNKVSWSEEQFVMYVTHPYLSCPIWINLLSYAHTRLVLDWERCCSRKGTQRCFPLLLLERTSPHATEILRSREIMFVNSV